MYLPYLQSSFPHRNRDRGGRPDARFDPSEARRDSIHSADSRQSKDSKDVPPVPSPLLEAPSGEPGKQQAAPRREPLLPTPPIPPVEATGTVFFISKLFWLSIYNTSNISSINILYLATGAAPVTAQAPPPEKPPVQSLQDVYEDFSDDDLDDLLDADGEKNREGGEVDEEDEDAKKSKFRASWNMWEVATEREREAERE